MIAATMIFAPTSALRAGLCSRRMRPPRCPRERLNGSLAALLTGSTAAHRQSRGRMNGGTAQLDTICAGLRVWVEVATGDVERRQCRFRVLRQPAAARFDKARDRLAGARRAGLAQYLGTAAQLGRQHDQSAVDVDPRAVDHDGPRDAE